MDALFFSAVVNDRNSQARHSSQELVESSNGAGSAASHFPESRSTETTPRKHLTWGNYDSSQVATKAAAFFITFAVKFMCNMNSPDGVIHFRVGWLFPNYLKFFTKRTPCFHFNLLWNPTILRSRFDILGSVIACF